MCVRGSAWVYSMMSCILILFLFLIKNAVPSAPAVPFTDGGQSQKRRLEVNVAVWGFVVEAEGRAALKDREKSLTKGWSI